MEDTLIYIWYITLLLFVIDFSGIIYTWVKKTLTALEGILIILIVGLLPIGMAYFAASTVNGWAGIGRGIMGYIYTSFFLAISALALLIYLHRKRS